MNLETLIKLILAAALLFKSLESLIETLFNMLG